MKKSRLLIRKILLPMLLALVFTPVLVSMEKASPAVATTQTNPTTTVYLDPPTINGTVVGQEFNVSVMIRDAHEIHDWQVGMLFNPDLLNCTGFFEGEFLKSAGDTIWTAGTIDNTTGEITIHAAHLLGNINASGDGRLGYLTFKVIAPGVSDLHLRDVVVLKLVFQFPVEVPINIIDVFTVVVNATTFHTVVIVSNSTGLTGTYHSGFYDHAFNLTLKEISFKVTGPYPGFSNVTIPGALLWGDFLVMIDSINASRTVTYNGTHYSLYFTYSKGIHEIHITTRPFTSSTISIALSSTNITLGENVTISGAIDPVRTNVEVTIKYRPSNGTWTSLANVTTDQNSNYTYTWTPEIAKTYEVQASWGGDPLAGVLGAESDVLTLKVLKIPSTISINLSEDSITMESNVTISGTITADDPINPLRPNVDVTIRYRPSGGDWSTLKTVTTDQNSKYNYTFKVEKIGTGINKAGTYEVKASWPGETGKTEGAESEVLTLTVIKIPSTISINLSEDSITMGSNVTISGAIDPRRPVATVTIRYRPSGGEWTLLGNTTTDGASNYNYTWAPETAGTYEVKASWPGDESTEGDESDVLTLKVKEAVGIPLEIVVVPVVAIIIIAAIAIYFVKFRK